MFRGQLRNKSFILIRILAPQFVIEMRNAQDNPNLLPQLNEQQQQRHRIRSAGNSYANALTRAQQP
jgi:hypothetical protein